METIAFILFVAFGLTVAVSGSVGIALMFRKLVMVGNLEETENEQFRAKM